MKTTLDTVDIVWQLLDASALKDDLSGAIFKHRRPVASDKEDVVVNSLAVNNTQLQQGLVNVNIYVPNLSITVNEATDGSQPDHVRLKELASMACGILDDNWDLDFNFDVQQQVVIMDEETKEHYINIRLNFYSINISN
jgi:hypothetical protein